jgi:hypothetical protein
MATSMMQHNKYQDEQQDQVLLEEQKQNIWKLLTAPTNRTKSAAATAEPTADDVGTLSLPRSSSSPSKNIIKPTKNIIKTKINTSK